MRFNADFVKPRYIFITISIILVVVSAIFIFTEGFNLGVDFLGGTEVVVGVDSHALGITDNLNSAAMRRVMSTVMDSNKLRIVPMQIGTSKKEDFFSLLFYPNSGVSTSTNISEFIASAFAKTYPNSKAANFEKFKEDKANYVKFVESLMDQTKSINNEIASLPLTLTDSDINKIRIDGNKYLQKLNSVALENDIKSFYQSSTTSAASMVNELQIEVIKATKVLNSLNSKNAQVNLADLTSEIQVLNGYLDNLKSNVKKSDVPGIDIQSISFVSGYASAEIASLSTWAIIVTVLAILIYITLRFKFIFGVGAIVALIHDVTITLGLFAIFRIPFDAPVVAAILTIFGYSLNDTIVVYDRIRENLKSMRSVPYYDIINLSINQTLSRSLNTSLTTLITVVVMLFFGGSVLKPFSFALTFGIIVGTYSSIYIASPILLSWLEKTAPRTRVKKASSKTSSKRKKKK
jgi:preprotein translocase subunit SecF